jgi:hypothetical protein
VQAKLGATKDVLKLLADYREHFELEGGQCGSGAAAVVGAGAGAGAAAGGAAGAAGAAETGGGQQPVKVTTLAAGNAGSSGGKGRGSGAGKGGSGAGKGGRGRGSRTKGGSARASGGAKSDSKKPAQTARGTQNGAQSGTQSAAAPPSGNSSDENCLGDICSALSLSAHVILRDEGQLPFQVQYY